MLLKIRLVLMLLCSCALANCQVKNNTAKLNNYKQLITQADAVFNSYSDTLYKGDPMEFTKKYSDLDKARNLYHQASTANLTQEYPLQRIDSIVVLMRDNEERQLDAEYNKVIKAADNSFFDEKYLRALELYKRAVGFKPAEQYPKDIIVKIEYILQNEK